ncbi:unnamed protein product [Paramecium primaurelia]|uniref:VPS9 domain-containing protein n=1 Tax=Paramecium primaurelia TaxID=5886 RepID=A0A8S1NJ11_PARPR|nr:unnamed protein product [Paramecium primaurelia]
MGNNQANQFENPYDIYKTYQNQWYIGVEREVQKLGYDINVRSDRFHKNNFISLYQIIKPEPEQIITMSTNESLFATELENMKRSKKTIDPFKEFQVTTLLQDCDPCLQDYEQKIINQLSTLSGSLLEIFQTFRQTQLPKTSQELDTLLIKFRDSYVQILIHYYDLRHYAMMNQCQFLNLQSLQCLVTNMIFNDEISSYVYQIKKLEQIQENERIHIKLLQSQNKTLADFGTSIKFCLDCTTRDYIQTKISSKINTNPQNNNNNLQQQDNYETLIIEDVDITQIPSRPQARLLQGTFFHQSPFEKAIQALQLIQFRQTPHHKIKQLIMCFQCIYSTILDYYQQFAQQPSNMSTDEMITIFNYVLCKSKLQNPYTHFQIMQKYLGNLDGVEGIYLTIMEATFQID